MVAVLLILFVVVCVVVLAILQVLEVETVAASELDRGRVFAVVLGESLDLSGVAFFSDSGAFELYF